MCDSTQFQVVALLCGDKAHPPGRPVGGRKVRCGTPPPAPVERERETHPAISIEFGDDEFS